MSILFIEQHTILHMILHESKVQSLQNIESRTLRACLMKRNLFYMHVNID